MMRAIQFSVLGDASVLKVAQVAIPSINENQLLVKNHASGVNFIDTYHRTGLYKVPLPYIPGRFAPT
jgi:NADPH2:quinone reductase